MPGLCGKLLIFWPHALATSVFVLNASHWLLNRVLKRNVRLHPPEVSLLKSKRQARNTMRQAGLQMVDYSFGPADLFVNIRHTTIDGPIIGTSLLLTLPFGTGGLTHFDFPSPVPLIPGEVYVIEVVIAGGDTSNPAIAGGYQAPYSQGRAIILGEPDPFDDLWFREGPAMATSGNCSLRACRDEILAACGSTHRLCTRRCTTLIRSRCIAGECTCDSVGGTPGTCICL